MNAASQKIAILSDRSLMLKKARQFFDERNILEVDCPIISPFASIDEHIDLIPVMSANQTRYLHSSPEHGMKRLIAQGLRDIYQLSHVFRDGEESKKHNPEFMMAEWYLVGKSFQTMIEETIDFIRLFIGGLPFEIVSYREAFQRYAAIDYVHATKQDLLEKIDQLGIKPYHGIENEGKNALLNIILGTIIEPCLGTHGKLTVLAYYPASQAALSQTIWKDDEHAAERFEVYYEGLELANGYHELADASEQRKRFYEENEARIRLKKTPLPIDENYIQALENGFPDCCGVAVGFDRLMMLRHQTTIENVIPFSWDQA